MEAYRQARAKIFHRVYVKIVLVLLMTVLLCQLPYLVDTAVIKGESLFNKTKWQNAGIKNYVIRTYLDDFSPYRGINTVTVENGNITKVEVDPKNQFPRTVNQNSFNKYIFLTVDGMFQEADDCGNQPIKNYWVGNFGSPSNYPDIFWSSCSFQYNPTYGYPTRIVIRCPNPDMCYKEIEVLEMNILPNSN